MPNHVPILLLQVYTTFGLRVLSSSCSLSLRLPIFPGWMESQRWDTSLTRKDAWTQTSPARRRIGHTKIQGAGKSATGLGPEE